METMVKHTQKQSVIKSSGRLPASKGWAGPEDSIAYDEAEIRLRLLELDKPLYVVRSQRGIGVTVEGQQGTSPDSDEALFESPAYLTPSPLECFGDSSFSDQYGTRYAYYGGAMANGIASSQMVVELGKGGFLGSFGSAGMVGNRLEAAIIEIKEKLPGKPFAFNLIHSPSEDALERKAVELFLKHGISIVEASAFLELTPSIVFYRAAGLSLDPSGLIIIGNRIIAKLSRKEVALKFLQPAPKTILDQLVAEKHITPLQADLAANVPMADDITVEGDSGGHTDNRPLVCLVPAMLALRDEIQEKYQYANPVRIGAAGGISTPGSALAAYMMGAAYVVTGSVNQACVESGACSHTKELLAKADMADVAMAPSADMFELGVKVQVLKNGTFFPMRAQKLYDFYQHYPSIDAIPLDEREKLEKQVFKRSLDSVWDETVKFFSERDPDQIARANAAPKRKMALIFRWYLGLSSRWSSMGDQSREMDYQIWCGPSIGPFNEWTRNTYLARPENRRVVDVARHILTGSAYLYRIQSLKAQGIRLASGLESYRPLAPLI